MGNFEFLEKVNPCIANLANTAEKLFRDEYFDQCIVQTRKMAEVMTRNVLGSKAETDDSFDDMLYKLKTISNNNFREQEFISDMYFLKKQGNIAVHSQNSKNNGKIALECLEHAFEASVNYAYAITHSDKINKLIFDEKLLVLGEKNTILQESYEKKLEEAKNDNTKDAYINKIKTSDNQISKKRQKNKSLNEKISTRNFDIKKLHIISKIFLISFGLAVCVLLVLSLLSISSEKMNIKKSKTTANSVKLYTNNNNHYDEKFSMTKTFSGIKN